MSYWSRQNEEECLSTPGNGCEFATTSNSSALFNFSNGHSSRAAVLRALRAFCTRVSVARIRFASQSCLPRHRTTSERRRSWCELDCWLQRTLNFRNGSTSVQFRCTKTRLCPPALSMSSVTTCVHPVFIAHRAATPWPAQVMRACGCGRTWAE